MGYELIVMIDYRKLVIDYKNIFTDWDADHKNIFIDWDANPHKFVI